MVIYFTVKMDSNLYPPDTEEESLQEFLCFLYTDDNARNCTESIVSSVGHLSVIVRYQYQKVVRCFPILRLSVKSFPSRVCLITRDMVRKNCTICLIPDLRIARRSDHTSWNQTWNLNSEKHILSYMAS